MKKLLIIFSGIFLLQCNVLLAQRGKVQSTSAPIKTISKEDLDASPFSKGKWEFDICRPNLSYSHKNIKVNDVSQGSQNQFALNLLTDYYVANHIGIGLELNTALNTYKNNNSKQTNNSWMTYANLTYGTSSNNFNFYARAAIGLGGSTDKYTPNTGNSSTDKTDDFGYKVLIGLPVQLQDEQPVYFTPEFGYSYLHQKFNGGTETDTRFGLGLKLETFLFCREMQCDSHNGYAFSNHSYDAGRSFLGISTRGMVDFGTTKSKNNGNFADFKQTYSQTDLSANYMYYFIPDLAIGAGVDFGSSTTKASATGNKASLTSFSFMPMLQLQIPVKDQGLNNLFLRGGYGFGMQNSKYTTGNNSTTTKYSTTDFCVGLGYNFFFHKGLAFTPTFDYDMSSNKNKTTSVKEKFNGPEFGIGVVKYF